MEITSIAKKIEERISLLAASSRELPERAKAKAEAISNYKAVKARAIVELTIDGKTTNSEGKVFQDPGATSRKEVADGACREELYKSILAESNYKNLLEGLDSAKSELSALQSIFRHMENT